MARLCSGDVSIYVTWYEEDDSYACAVINKDRDRWSSFIDWPKELEGQCAHGSPMARREIARLALTKANEEGLDLQKAQVTKDEKGEVVWDAQEAPL